MIVDPPPSFAPYPAEFSLSSHNNIVSHDPHLNSDGEALYRFLLQQALIPPTFTLHCAGSHTETHTRWVTVQRNGAYESRQETYTESITDFDFRIDIAHLFLSFHDPPRPVAPLLDPHTGLPPVSHLREIEPILYSVPDFEPAYRGSMVQEILVPDPHNLAAFRTRQPSSAELHAHRRWAADRADRGLPPWSFLPPSSTAPPPSEPSSSSVLLSSFTPRQWADAYCASPKLLKEFTFRKVPYGFDTSALTQHIRALISSSLYSGQLSVQFNISADKVHVRPDHRLSRLLSNWWFKLLLWLTLLYPFLWLFKRFHHLGGGRWEVCGGAYALKRWVQPDHSKLPSQPESLQLLGTREGEWLRCWSPTILRAVVSRYQSDVPLTTPDTFSTASALITLPPLP